ncbi:Hsp33 family molecular chaperone [Bartonella krasnovii]|uniref:Hsp33 family molecular chaperone n=1 Tax=Bartonella krasnovii TaxID=2267275 RepID=A0A5B9D3I1_9HYPH|nr:Hsp33 family molecular chaperone [Bartonella krasnovii]QEE13093.1 Hsp33 family molecular chaperone [Bartonella krasnovii]UNF42268.1 Hsp33 family molecular chaperone [Bartonella krasnovii]UNF47111.1 Hsp33 family molecular chaperone [Bartonella krasnovii]UNF52121.1 Hsp33 family molecular chaperone [Bartonella krasnovii]UNF55476.1 Hsp33 family molecular chaperone [Bartonella krasnovii]
MSEQAKDDASLNDISLHEEDAVIPFQVEELDIRGRVVQLGKTLDSILNRHQYPEPVSYLLAEALLLTVLLGTSLKLTGKFILQTHSDGPVNMLVCDFSPPSSLRGYARFDKEQLKQAIDNDQISSKNLLGKGTLAFTIDQGPNMQPYQGIVALDGSNLQEAARTYFDQSEQISTDIRLAVAILINRDNQGKPQKSWRAGGILTQFLPQASSHHQIDNLHQKREETKDQTQLDNQWQEAKILMATIESSELTDPQVGSKRLLYRLFHEQGVRVFNPFSLVDQCSCSREKIKGMLESFPSDERNEMVKNKYISVTCEFCSKMYRFTLQEFLDEKI